ncbi:MAG: tetratricopeptide repeat protein [Acidobacteriota bacterium]
MTASIPGRIAYAAALACLGVYAFHEINSYDTPWHLRTGRLILEERSIPRTDPFSFTAPKDRPWINHEWLSDVIFAVADRAGGPAALIVLVTIASLATAVMATMPAGDLAAITLLLATQAAAPRLQARPHVVTSLLAILFLRLGAKLLASGDRRLLVTVVALDVLWANLHGGFFLAPVLLAILLLGAAVDRWRGSPLPAGIREVGAAALLCLVAPVLNPSGFALYREIATTFSATDVGEWGLPIVPGQPVEQPTLYLLILAVACVAAAIAAVVWRRQALRTSDVLVLVLFLALGLSARRNSDLGAFGLAFAMTGLLSSLEPAIPKAAGTALAAVAMVLAPVFAFDFASGRYATRNGFPGAFGSGFARGTFPDEPAAWVIAHAPKGELWNDYDVGGYLIFRLGPERKVCMDGRNVVYGEETMRAYQEARTDGRKLVDLLDRWRIGYAVLGHTGATMGMHAVMLAHPDFALAHVDATGAVYVRRSMNPGLVPDPPLLAQGNLGELPAMPASPPGPLGLIARVGLLGPAVGRYGPHHSMGSFLSIAGQPERARRELRLAAAETPYAAEVWFNLGAAELQSHAYPEAEQALRASLLLKPGDLDARFGLATALAARGSKGDALAMYRALLAEGPPRVDVRVALVKLLHDMGDTKAAIQELRAMVNTNPARVDAQTELASYLAEEGDKEGAERELRAVLARAPTFVPALGNLASMMLAREQWSEARRLAETALASSRVDPVSHKVAAYCDLHDGRYDVALTHFQLYVSRASTDLNARNDMAVCLLQLGRRDEARRILVDLLASKPDFAPAQENLQKMAMGPE